MGPTHSPVRLVGHPARFAAIQRLACDHEFGQVPALSRSRTREVATTNAAMNTTPKGESYPSTPTTSAPSSWTAPPPSAGAAKSSTSSPGPSSTTPPPGTATGVLRDTPPVRASSVRSAASERRPVAINPPAYGCPMAPRPRWHHMVMAGREEALQAVEIHNSPLTLRPLEGFLVHMHIAWLYVLHAGFERNGVDYHYRLSNGRYEKVDGDRKSWDLTRSTKERWPNSAEPVRVNLELTAALRNKIEHRYERGLQVISYGFTQALTVNFENELVSEFGEEYSIADKVHLPVSLSAYTRDGAAAMVAAQAHLPRRLQDWIIDYRSGLAEDVRTSKAFEFRIEITQKRSPRSEADLAVEFVRLEDLTPEEVEAYEGLERTGRVIIREKQAPDPAWMRPAQAAAAIQDELGWRFHRTAEFPKAWAHYNVRPASTATGDARKRTDLAYCKWDPAFEQYVYNKAFVAKVVEDCSTSDGFSAVIGWDPKELPPE